MLDGISLIGLLVALALPWLGGALVARWLLDDWPLAIGYGFFVGQLIVIGLVWSWDALGLRLAFAPIATVLVLLSGSLAGLLARRAAGPIRPALPRPDWSAAAWTGVALLLALVAVRAGMMAQELATRPLFAWDAWMNWVPKAVVWFEHRELTRFELPPAWLAAPPDTEIYSLGNWRASDYPPGVPLMLLWVMLGAGTSDHTLVFLPWLIAPAAFALVLWRLLRADGSGPVVAMLAIYLFASPPLVASHVMLVGYADLWLALFFSLGVMAVDALSRRPGIGWGTMTLAMALGCGLMKTPGVVFGALVVGLAALVALGARPPWWRWLALAGLTAIGAILALGVLPFFEDGEAVLPLPFFLPDLRLQPEPLLPILLQQLFGYAQWHLLWLALPLACLAAALAGGRRALGFPAVTAFVAATGVLVFVFGMTHYFRQAENLVTLNRTLLYPAPLACYLIGRWLAMTGRTAHADA
jgi:hypothetical protein